MGIKIMMGALAAVGVLAGSVVGITASAAPSPVNTTQKMAKMECAYAGDCVQNQIRLQDQEQIRTQDCVNTYDGTQDQIRAQNRIQNSACTQDKLRTQAQIRAGK